MVWVRIWKISPKNVIFFNFFPFGSKKIASGWVGKYLGQSRVGLLFTAGQKLARVGSGPITTIFCFIFNFFMKSLFSLLPDKILIFTISFHCFFPFHEFCINYHFLLCLSNFSIKLRFALKKIFIVVRRFW